MPCGKGTALCDGGACSAIVFMDDTELARLRPNVPIGTPDCTELPDPRRRRRRLPMLVFMLAASHGFVTADADCGVAESGSGMTTSTTLSRRGILPNGLPGSEPATDPAREPGREPPGRRGGVIMPLVKLATELDLCSWGGVRSSSNGKGAEKGNDEAGMVRRKRTTSVCDKLR